MGVVGGFKVWPDGRTRGLFTHNPSTLRLSMVDPNLTNIPTGHGDEVARWVREVFVALLGSLFWARDFKAIEFVLVGYFAGSARCIRLAKLGVHAYLASHILGRPADLSWSDVDLKDYFRQIKEESITIYDTAKRVVYLSSYRGTPRRMQYEYPETFPEIKDAARLQGLFFELLPEIPEWHRDLCIRVDGTKVRKKEPGEVPTPWTLGVCEVWNPFGYLHRFYNVLDWEPVIVDDVKRWIWSYGSDAKRLIANLPQSTAAGIIKRAAKTLYYDHPHVGETLRLLIHDEVFGEAKENDIEECLRVSKEVMEAPIPQLPLNPDWQMGEFLSIETESKVGRSWASMS